MTAATLDSNSLPVEYRTLFRPSLEELATVLESGLKKTFADVVIQVTDCPDLTKEPFTLAAAGLCGKPRLLDLGGVPYLIPLARTEKVYDMKELPKLIDLPDGAFMIGAGAGPWPYINQNCEMMPNLKIDAEGQIVQETSISWVNLLTGMNSMQKLPASETRCALLANLFCSEGKSGKVLEVTCKKRIGEENFVSCMRKILAEKYRGKSVGLGGTFMIQSGKAKIHVMPNFSPIPLQSDQEISNWLQYYEMNSPLICLSFFVSECPGLDVRLEHTHCFSHHGDGGHYHYDTTPETVEYHGYFNVAELCYRIDKPIETHEIGRD